MSIGTNPRTIEDLTPEMEVEMERYGITRFPVYYFQFGQHKYSNLKDATAQAERERGVD